MSDPDTNLLTETDPRRTSPSQIGGPRSVTQTIAIGQRPKFCQLSKHLLFQRFDFVVLIWFASVHCHLVATIAQVLHVRGVISVLGDEKRRADRAVIGIGACGREYV